ncbi:TFIIH/NER complex subunit [Saccharomycopsis crataegensis]|uniref:RNA polymerase II transcription factor B subunit 3 n=1 Tax=Saccharomycopsis crataegensis TaxID=43959 RepID=A0AAV5QTT4_9ASCO|nr:TFIIH/NER complex subunit [Saccharomycopsis crataegensis]
MTEVADSYLEDINNDVCPICKTDKYLNSNMKFLINPECYHKICDSCVDRIFSSGPTKCPYQGCEKILRKNKFKSQIFEDISIEKEIDIRNSIVKIFNKTEKDFKTLEEFNAYLEKIEEIIYNILNGVQVKETNEYIANYKQENSKSIHQNNINIQRQHDIFLKIENKKKLINDEKQKLSKQLIRELQNDKKIANQQITNNLLNSSLDTNLIVENARKNLLKQSSARRKKYIEQTKLLQEKFMSQEDLEMMNYSNPGLPGFRKHRLMQQQATMMSPFSPFNGDRSVNLPFEVEEEYFDPYTSNVIKDAQYLAGGIRVEQIYKKSLFEAFFGLDCIIKEEKSA